MQQLRIISKREGFRRCGVSHSETATYYDLSAFTGEQIDMLVADPMLVVDVVDVGDDGAVTVASGVKGRSKAVKV